MTISMWSDQQPFMRSQGRPINTVLPSITPATTPVAVGAVLTLQPGTWQFSTSLSYQWLLAGVPIPGEVALTLNTLGLTLGVITCRVTATSATGATVQVVTSNGITLI